MNHPASLDNRLEQFELASQGSNRPDLVQFWALIEAEVPWPARLTWLHELIKVDLEYRWSLVDGKRGLLDDYALLFGELGPVHGWPVDLIAEEFRARQRWGDRPTLREYVQRFPGRIDLEAALRHAQEEIDHEWRAHAVTEAPKSATVARDPRAPLDYRDFMLKELVGSGGMGKVYRAWQPSVGRTVAVKMLRKSRWTVPGATERFIEEALVVSQLRHPGIVGVHGVGQTPGGGVFIVMDFVAGSNLAEVMAGRQPPRWQAASWIAEAACALEYAHQRGVVHCDVKPSNFVLEQTGRVLLTDFGLAASLAVPVSERSWAGTLGFMAPEQLDHEFGDISAATDIFALGLVLHRLLTGRAIFQGKQIIDALTARDDREDWLGIDLESDIPVELRDVLVQCLMREPTRRIPSAEEVAKILRESAERWRHRTPEELE